MILRLYVGYNNKIDNVFVKKSTVVLGSTPNKYPIQFNHIHFCWRGQTFWAIERVMLAWIIIRWNKYKSNKILRCTTLYCKFQHFYVHVSWCLGTILAMLPVFKATKTTSFIPIGMGPNVLRRNVRRISTHFFGILSDCITIGTTHHRHAPNNGHKSRNTQNRTVPPLMNMFLGSLMTYGSINFVRFALFLIELYNFYTPNFL